MITYVAKAVNLVASLILTVVDITSSIGQVIFLLIITISSFIFNSFKSVLMFFQIVYEDNVSIFTEDLPNLTSDLTEAMYYQSVYLHDILMNIHYETTYKLELICSNIKWSLSAVFNIFSEVIHILKSSIIFVGDTLWLVLTFVPIHLPYLLKAYLKILTDIIVAYAIDSYMALLKVTNFLSDVPLESFIGIVSAILLVRSYIYFREAITSCVNIIYWILRRKFTYLYYAAYNYFTNSEVRLIAQMVGDQQATRNTESDTVNDNDDPVDALCVICQERQKCVLTLPCRHVCLCSECCMRLYGYQRTCPICRTFIYHSVTIYL